MIFSTKLRLLCVLVILFIGLGASAAIYVLYKGHPHVKPSESQKDMNRNAIVSNGIECADIGMNIFRKHNGTAVDAMIATLFCEGITVVQSMGLGGGFVATLYHKEANRIETLTARERAPIASTEDMFGNATEAKGILSVATPGELKGYWAMHQKYGRVPWKTLIQPSIELCRKGHIVTSYLAEVLFRFRENIKAEPSLREIFIDPTTNEVWKVDNYIKRPQLAKTLEIIAEEGVDSIYSANGTIAKLLVDDIKALGGIVTIEDLVQYTVEWKKPISTKLRNNLTLYSTPLPSSGNVLAMILNVMDGYEADDSVLFFHRLIETYKFAYARRSHLGDVDLDPQFLNEFTNRTFAKQIRDRIWDNQTFNDHNHYGSLLDNGRDAGTAHVSVMAQNGDTVTVTSTINNILGAKLRSRKTGILLNDEMDDFSSPRASNASPANFIKPGKRPFSSMCPSIIMDSNNNVVLVIGGAGGPKITTSTAYSTIRHLWKKDSLKDSIRAKRIHHPLWPMQIDFEADFDTSILSGLKAKGHDTKPTGIQVGFSAITAISKAHNILEVSIDPRRNGSCAIF